jgi:hypothetical protein
VGTWLSSATGVGTRVATVAAAREVRHHAASQVGDSEGPVLVSAAMWRCAASLTIVPRLLIDFTACPHTVQL